MGDASCKNWESGARDFGREVGRYELGEQKETKKAEKEIGMRGEGR